MVTNYDRIAEDYKASKLAPWREHIEAYTLFTLLGDLAGKSVLDLACGEGIYSRSCRRLGAETVVGVDLSERMIELAQTQEQSDPVGVTYHCGDAMEVDLGQQFDIVLASYLFNYASTAEQMLCMATAAARHLKPNGRLVAVNNNPAQSVERYAATRPFGMVKSTAEPLREGTPITYTIYLADDHPFSFDNYYLSVETHEQVLGQAGFREVTWQPCRLSPRADRTMDWQSFLIDPPVTFIEARR